jgi:hypothetical protein
LTCIEKHSWHNINCMLQIFVYLSQHHPTCFLPIQKHYFTKVAAAEQQKHQHLVNEYKQYTSVMSISTWKPILCACSGLT